MSRRGLRLLVALCVAAALFAGAVIWLLRGDGVRLAFERQASTWLAQPVHIGGASAQLLPRIGVRLHDVTVGDPVRVTLATVDVSTGIFALLSRRIEEAELTIADSRLDLPLPFAIRGSGPSAASAGAGFRIVSVRRISLQRVRATSRGRELEVSADSSWSGGRLTLSTFSATADRTNIRGNGAIDFSRELDANLKMDADRLDLDDLLALATAFAPASGQSTTVAAPSGRLTARISARSMSAGRLAVTQFSATARVEGGRVSLSPARLSLFGGRFEGDLDLGLRDARSMTIMAQIKELDVAQLAAFGGAADTVTGKLSGSAMLKGRGDDLANLLASAQGNGTATITNGSIRNLNLLRTVVLFFGRPAPATEAASDAFERMDASFTLRDQVLTAEALSLRSRDADIVGAGTFQLRSNAIDARADLSLSEALSAQAGTDLYRYTREGNRIVLPATIGGTLGAPSLSIDAGAALQRGLKNEVDRRLRGLIDRLPLKR